MAFQEVGSGSYKYVKYTECQEGEVIAEGHYKGTKQGQFGIQHLIKADGTTVVLNSAGALNKTLENDVSKGDYVRVTFLGKDVVKSGKFKNKEFNNFKIEVDPSRAISGASLGSDPVDSDDEVGDDEVESDVKVAARLAADDDEAGMDEEAEEAPAPAPAAKLAAAPAPVATTAKTKRTAEEVLASYRKKA